MLACAFGVGASACGSGGDDAASASGAATGTGGANGAGGASGSGGAGASGQACRPSASPVELTARGELSGVLAAAADGAGVALVGYDSASNLIGLTELGADLTANGPATPILTGVSTSYLSAYRLSASMSLGGPRGIVANTGLGCQFASIAANGAEAGATVVVADEACESLAPSGDGLAYLTMRGRSVTRVRVDASGAMIDATAIGTLPDTNVEALTPATLTDGSGLVLAPLFNPGRVAVLRVAADGSGVGQPLVLDDAADASDRRYALVSVGDSALLVDGPSTLAIPATQGVRVRVVTADGEVGPAASIDASVTQLEALAATRVPGGAVVAFAVPGASGTPNLTLARLDAAGAVVGGTVALSGPNFSDNVAQMLPLLLTSTSHGAALFVQGGLQGELSPIFAFDVDCP
ncbi:MAG TPA: hypothetical protein VGM56_20255 [Byssovorax sp.]